MIALIATLQIKDGSTREFEHIFARLAGSVRSNEPENVVYRLCRTRGDENTYKVLEIYRDEAALEEHGKSEHFRAAGPDLGRSSMAGRTSNISTLSVSDQ